MRISLRAFLVGVVALGSVLGSIAGLRRRSESFWHQAAYHEQAAGVLVLEVGEVCTDGLEGEADIEKAMAGRGKEALLAYRAVQYHEGLAAKYARAAARPWRWVEADPAPPPLAFPKFVFDPTGRSSEDPSAEGGFR